MTNWGFVLDNADIQESIVTKLKADTNLTTWLAARSSANEIREDEWQGSDFAYPNVRIEVVQQEDMGDPPCHILTLFNVFSYAEGYSSLDCDVLSGLVRAALRGKHLTGTGFMSLKIALEGSPGAVQAGDRIWRATEQFSALIRQDS